MPVQRRRSVVPCSLHSSACSRFEQREGESRHQQLLSRLEQERLKRLDEEKKQRAAAQQRQLDEMQMMLQNVRLEREREMESLRRDFQVRDKKLWEDIDRVIADEERKAAEKKREEERRRKEEQERLEGEEKARKEAEEKRLQEEKEKKLQEELQRQKEAKDAQEKKEREEAEIAVAAEKQKQLEALGQMSAQLGVLSPELEWEAGWKTLERIKKEIHPGIKADRSLKDARNRLRRQIVPKIGQLTADAQQIDRVVRRSKSLLSCRMLTHPCRPPA
jgi:nucleoporin GLE1